MLENYKVLGDRVIVKAKQDSNKTDGGLIIPTSAQSLKPMLELEIAAVGEGIKGLLNIGDIAIFFAQSGAPITIDREDYKIVAKNDILMVKSK
jgi:co-chaperonin GroES (HSP10)